MIDKLITEINTIANFSEEDISLFIEALEESIVLKGEYFLKEGQISNRFGYIASGLMMYYKIIDGNEIPTDFALKDDWVVYLKSYTTGFASDMNIKALEDTSIFILSSSKMEELLSIQPKFMALRSYYTELSFVRISQQIYDLTTLNAKKRYNKFSTDYPELIKRVPQYYIAAYLGIKPQSLSRIRK